MTRQEVEAIERTAYISGDSLTQELCSIILEYMRKEDSCDEDVDWYEDEFADE